MPSRIRWISAFAVALLLLPGLYSFNSLVAQDRKAARSPKAVLLIHGTRPTLLPGSRIGPDDRSQKTLVAFIKTGHVLKAALRDPKLASLKLFENADSVEELRAGLIVEFDTETSFLTVRYKHADPAVAAQVVRSVVDSYMTNVVEGEKGSALDRLERLRKIWDHYQNDLKKKQQAMRSMQEAVGSSPSGSDLAKRAVAARAKMDGLELRKADVAARIASAKARNVKRDDLTDELAGIEARLELLKQRVEELRRLRSNMIDVSQEEDEIRLGRETADKLGREIERMEVELHAPSRIMIVNLPD